MNLNDWRGKGKFTRFRGHRVFHVVEGRGPDVVLVHGFPVASWGWRRIWPRLTARHRAVAPDLSGFGFSDKPRGGPYGVAEHADLVEALLDELDAEAPHVIASAYGVSVAQELLARHLRSDGPLLRSVCFLGGGLFPELNPVLPSQKLLLSPVGGLLFRVVPFPYFFFRRSVRRMFGTRRPPSDDELRDLWRLLVANGGKRVIHELMRYHEERETHRDRWVGALRGADVRLGLIVGRDDPVSGGQAERWREVVAGRDPVVLDSVGHYPQLEAPGAVMDSFEAMVGDRPG